MVCLRSFFNFFAFILIGPIWALQAEANIQPIQVSLLSPLQFRPALKGDGAEVIPADSFETAENASLEVKGPRLTTFYIQLPQEITMAGNNGGTLTVSGFTSSIGNQGVLGLNGKKIFYVGATRNPIPFNIPSGTYSGTFPVLISY